ncbi:MAG: hypothetical protein ABSC05_28365 [Candidatus Solibacter sp.]|jgi:hypothetical protein
MRQIEECGLAKKLVGLVDVENHLVAVVGQTGYFDLTGDNQVDVGERLVLIVDYLLEAAGEGTKMADHFSPIFRPAFPSSANISERSSPSRVRFAAPNNGAPLTAPGRSGQHS